MTPTAEFVVHFFAAVHNAAQYGLLLFGLHRLWMLYHWLRVRAVDAAADGSGRVGHDCPTVTVQLPIYNERFVAARLVDAVAQLDWPHDRLEIQVLDDSTDDTRRETEERAAYWTERGRSIVVIRRRNREGYKAGALAAGLRVARGEFIAVFDADFLPQPGFLRQTVGCFAEPHVGMVQARWGFVNAEHSWLTRAQAVSLDAHFQIEHQVRYAQRLFFNFNGTAGVWRRRAIEDAGGWQDDTVTEDLDLSYRAQLAGWRFVYLDGVVVPSELPMTLGALRVQQHRWAKGSMQTAKKILPRLLGADLPLRIKAEAAAHLLGNVGWLLGATLLATLYPAIVARAGRGWYQFVFSDLPLLLGSSGAILAYFACAAIARKKRRGWVLLLPFLSVGLAPVISAGVIAGLCTRGGCFERTPKFGVRGRESLPLRAFLYQRRTIAFLVLNALLFLYGALPLAFAIRSGTWLAIPILLLVPAGYLAYVAQDAREMAQVRAGFGSTPPASGR